MRSFDYRQSLMEYLRYVQNWYLIWIQKTGNENKDIRAAWKMANHDYLPSCIAGWAKHALRKVFNLMANSSITTKFYDDETKNSETALAVNGILGTQIPLALKRVDELKELCVKLNAERFEECVRKREAYYKKQAKKRRLFEMDRYRNRKLRQKAEAEAKAKAEAEANANANADAAAV